MIGYNGRYYIGYFKGMPYADDLCIEDFEEYRKYKNTIPKDKIIGYLKTLPCGIAASKNLLKIYLPKRR